MQKMRKILALMLCAFMSVSLLVPIASAAEFSDVDSNHRYFEAINYLASVGIINGFEDGSFKPEDTVTRAQFAKIMAYALKSDNIVATKQIFTDVPVDHWAAGNIEAMVSLGIINGMGDGTFAPESPVLYEQAVKMTVCALGYGDIANNNGGYPNGHLKVATTRGFIKGVSDGVVGIGANRGLIAKLIDNMLGIDQLDIVTGEVIQGSSSKEDSGTSTAKGQVVATYKTGLTKELEDICKKNEVLLRYSNDEEEIFFIENDTNEEIERMAGFLGKSVNITYSEDSSGDYIITSITGQKGKNETFSLKSKDMYDFDETSNVIEYYDEDSGDFEEISVADDAYVIYNGRATNKELDDVMTELMAGDGTIDFLASSGDYYDVLFVKSYKTIIAGGSPTTSSTDDKMVVIYNINNPSERYEIPKETYSNLRKKVTYTLNGNSATYASISQNAVVSMAISDDEPSTVFDIMVSTNKKSSVEIKSMSLDESKISLGGTEYDISPMFKTYIEENPGIVSVGAKGDFSLDAFGKVVAMKVSATTYTYGYVTSYEEETGSKGKEPLAIQVYVASGTKISPKIYGFKKNFYVNGEKYNIEDDDDVNTVIGLLEASAAAFVADGKMKGSEVSTSNHNISQPIEFSTSGLTDATNKPAIDRLFIYDPVNTNKTALITSGLVLSTKETDETNISKANCVFEGSKRKFNGYYIDSTSKIIFVPEDKATAEFYNRPYSFLNEDAEYNYQIFDATSGYTAGLVIIYATEATSAASLTYSDTPYIVSKTGTSSLFTDEDGNTEQREVISLIKCDNKSEDTYFYGEDTKVYTVKLSGGSFVKDKDVAFDDLKVGDIVRVIINEDKTLADVEIVVQRDELNSVTDFVRGIGTGSGTAHKESENASYRTVIATAKNWDSTHTNNLIIVPAFADSETTIDDSVIQQISIPDSTKIYVVDTAKDDESALHREGNKSDIIALNGNGTINPGEIAPGASKLLVFTSNSSVKFIVVFK